MVKFRLPVSVSITEELARFASNFKNPRVLILSGLFIALEIILTRFVAVNIPPVNPIIRISFGFLPVALCAALFGPLTTGVVAVLCDILGMLIAPKGVYFPGFTISYFITGMTFGIFLFNKPKSILRIAICVTLITLVVDLGFNTLWLTMITGKAYLALIVPRLVKSAMMLAVQTFLIHYVWKLLMRYGKQYLSLEKYL